MKTGGGTRKTKLGKIRSTLHFNSTNVWCPNLSQRSKSLMTYLILSITFSKKKRNIRRGNKNVRKKLVSSQRSSKWLKSKKKGTTWIIFKD